MASEESREMSAPEEFPEDATNEAAVESQFFGTAFTKKGAEWCHAWSAAEKETKRLDQLGEYSDVSKAMGLLWQIVREDCSKILDDLMSKTNPDKHAKSMQWPVWFALKSAIYSNQLANAKVLTRFLGKWRVKFPPKNWIDDRMLRVAGGMRPTLRVRLMKLAMTEHHSIKTLPKILETPTAHSEE